MKSALVFALAACGRLGFDARVAADGAGDAPSDSASATACGTTSVLADSFQASAPSSVWYTYANGGGSFSQGGGELVITLPATTLNASHYTGYVSAWYYDLRGSRIYVEVNQVVSTATHAQSDIQVVGVSGDELAITEEAGMLSAAINVGGARMNVQSIAYDAAQERWWQIREAQGTVYFETSPDGVTFTPFATTPTPAYASIVNVVLEAGAFQTEMNAGSTRFAHLNGDTPSARWCGASALRDDFNSGAVGDVWGASYAMGGCTLAESAGNLNIALATTGKQDCALVSASGYDLSADSVFAVMTTAPNTGAQTFSYLRASTPGGDNVEVTQIANTLTCAQNVGNTFTSLAAVPYDPINHKFFRLAGSGGNLLWQTSPDGTTWTTQLAKAPPIPIDAVNLAIGAGTGMAVGAPGTATFSTFDQLPP